MLDGSMKRAAGQSAAAQTPKSSTIDPSKAWSDAIDCPLCLVMVHVRNSKGCIPWKSLRNHSNLTSALSRYTTWIHQATWSRTALDTFLVFYSAGRTRILEVHQSAGSHRNHNLCKKWRDQSHQSHHAIMMNIYDHLAEAKWQTVFFC